MEKTLEAWNGTEQEKEGDKEKKRNVIELKNVVKNYEGFQLDNISFEVPRGSIVGFIGQNGAGKTTTISLILDLIQRDGGEITVFGKDVISDGVAIKEDIGVIFDEMGYHENMTPLQLGKMFAQIYKNWNGEEYKNYLTGFGLPYKKKCGAFSRGMRMKLQLAVALSHGAKLLILDEPTSGLDPIIRNEVLEIFQEYVMTEEHTIFLSSHILEDLERIADEIIFIDKGRILLSGNKDEMLFRHGILKCSNEDMERIDGAYIVDMRSSSFGTEILVNDYSACARKYPDMVLEHAGLEDIMLFYVQRNNKMNRSRKSKIKNGSSKIKNESSPDEED